MMTERVDAPTREDREHLTPQKIAAGWYWSKGTAHAPCEYSNERGKILVARCLARYVEARTARGLMTLDVRRRGGKCDLRTIKQIRTPYWTDPERLPDGRLTERHRLVNIVLVPDREGSPFGDSGGAPENVVGVVCANCGRSRRVTLEAPDRTGQIATVCVPCDALPTEARSYRTAA